MGDDGKNNDDDEDDNGGGGGGGGGKWGEPIVLDRGRRHNNGPSVENRPR